MIEVFKTNVQRQAQSKALLEILSDAFPATKITFDLCDCDKVLRIEGDRIEASKIVGLLNKSGFVCEPLE